MGGGMARIEGDSLLELRHRTIGTARPQADEAESEAGVWVTAVKSHRALGQLERLVVIAFGILRPAEIGRVAHRDRQRRDGLWVIRMDRHRPSKKRLRLDVVCLAVAIVVPHPMLIEFVGILIVLWLVGNAVTLEF